MIDTNFPLYATAFFATFLITVFTERLLIPALSKRAKQPIYEEGPSWHSTKRGTPTMGGLAFLLATNLALSGGCLFLLLNNNAEGALSLLICLGYATANALVGVIDDRTKLKRKENKGLSPSQKLIAQAILTALFLLLRTLTVKHPTVISFSFGSVDLGYFYYPLTFFILLGITNCANLTDGIDGLASGVGFAISISLFYISCAFCEESAFISAALTGATAGFLIFNLHPAKIFMGDTGSLFLGAIASAAAVALGNPLLILFIGAVYVLEGVSVIMQVIWYKATKKRLFKMAPLHHHLEKSSWSENKICIVGIILTLLLSIPAFIFYLP